MLENNGGANRVRPKRVFLNSEWDRRWLPIGVVLRVEGPGESASKWSST